MTVHHHPADAPFFAQWAQRAPGSQRDLERVARLLVTLDLAPLPCPVLSVVGSKGKGTITTYASATLAAAGQRVVTITSPALLENRERLRLNGEAISEATYERLSSAIRLALATNATLTAWSPARGTHVSPAGLYLLAGLLLARDEQADVLVVEAGMGGRSDEVSLLEATLCAIGPIFGEHRTELGPHIRDIARDKSGVIGATTHAAWSVAQSPVVRREIVAQAQHTQTHVRWLNEAVLPPAVASLEARVQWPAGLSATSAHLGVAAALDLLEHLGRRLPESSALEQVLNTIPNTGRGSVHTDATGHQWVLEAVVNAEGVRGALDSVHRRGTRPSCVVLGLPSSKGYRGVKAATATIPVIPVGLPASEYLKFGRTPFGPPQPLDHVLLELQHQPPSPGTAIVVCGTWSCIAHAIARLHLPIPPLFLAPGPAA